MTGRDDVRGAIREFLTTRRAKVAPEQAGLPAFGGNRRVPGLRREEVALLAGISVEYYTQLERGMARGASAEVLDSIARALRLDAVERDHLLRLMRPAGAPGRAAHGAAPDGVRSSVRRLLDTMTGAAAFVRNGRLDVLHANRLAAALYAPMFLAPVRPPNLARFVFLDPAATALYGDWDGIAAAAVGSLRAETGRFPHDRTLAGLVAELSERSEGFRRRWAAHDVEDYRSGRQPFRHPVVGDLVLDYDALELPSDPGLTIVAYTAQEGSPSQRALDLLATPSSGPA